MADDDPWGTGPVEASDFGAQDSGFGRNQGGFGDNANQESPKRNGGFGGGNIRFGGGVGSFKPRDSGFRGADADGEEPRPPAHRPDEVDLEQEEKYKIGQGINFDRYDKIDVNVKGADLKPINEFGELITSELLLENIKRAGYKKLTPIQRYTIPALAQNHDLVGCAQTGSGKTAAFLLPVLQYIMNLNDLDSQYGQDCQRPYCIVMAPTRELARQTYVEALKLSRDSVIKCQCIYGGIQTGYLRAQLNKGTHILVSTPGRLKDFLERRWISLENLKYIILDEGDRLIDQGFVVDMRALFLHETMPPKESRQTLFFSATFKAEAQGIAKEFMKSNYIFITVGMVGAANQDVKQEFVQVERQQKKRELLKILQGLNPDEKVIVFTQTKATADIISSYLTQMGVPCTSIHGDRHQSQREEALNHFKRGIRKCLVASPVGERGLDLPDVSTVINYDMPNELDEYIHRIGRTGRIGNTGRAISFYDPQYDSRIATELRKAVEQAQQVVPDFLNRETGGANDDFGDNCGAGFTNGDVTEAAAPTDQADEMW